MLRCTPAFLMHAPVTVAPFLLHFHQSPLTSRANQSPVCTARSFDEAVKKGFVVDFGRTVQLDRDGRFPLWNDLQISQQLRRKLQVAIDAILTEGGSANVEAIFVRGSIVNGQHLRGGRSDLDLIVVLRQPISEVLKEKIRSSASKVAETHLNLSGADIRYLEQRVLSQQSNLPDTQLSTQIMLNNYSILLYGNDTRTKRFRSRQKPTDEIALNIRKEERSFIRLFDCGKKMNDVNFQIKAIQWLCKRGLRAIADLSSDITKKHSRDLVPCYKLGAEAFPMYNEFLLLCLQIACANAENRFVGLSRDGFVEEGCNVARNLVEVVEEVFLRKSFVFSVETQLESQARTPLYLLPSKSVTRNFQELFSEKFAYSKHFLLPSRWRKRSRPEYLRTKPPTVKLNIGRSVHELHTGFGENPLHASNQRFLHQILRKVSSPIVYRNATRRSGIPQKQTSSILEDLLKTNLSVQCRISPDNTFVFCRSSHNWIESGRFQPPSILIPMPTAEAILRLQVSSPLRTPLFYTDSPREQIYIQTQAKRAQQLLNLGTLSDTIIAQEERIWISTHGSVSGLHYDASYSVLIQRTGAKRMLFFHPDCLRFMGIYPLGHPLHRRARVNLTRVESVVFREFWDTCASQASEALLKAGDAIVFPPFWAHYTESLTEHDDELSISHTLRYL